MSKTYAWVTDAEAGLVVASEEVAETREERFMIDNRRSEILGASRAVVDAAARLVQLRAELVTIRAALEIDDDEAPGILEDIVAEP